MFALVLHSHLPWFAHHGRWPVGEEWLYQSWASSYLPIMELLGKLADDGRSDVLTLGMTPVLSAQLDDPYSLDGMHHWLGNWQLRAHEAARRPGDLGPREHALSAHALELFESRWRHGGSAVLRPLVDNGIIELLGGPLMHPFQPLLHPRLRHFSLTEGLRDAEGRWGRRPAGIWAPECGYTPGMEKLYAATGVEHFMVDGPALHGDTALGRTVGDTDVVAFGRDLPTSYRVWSPKSGYPGHGAYRDFHTYDHETGLKPSRVTGKGVDSSDKAPYDPVAASAVVDRHVREFVEVVRLRLRSENARLGRPALVVAAFDTELFGHWWHEGPEWLAGVLRALPEAGIDIGTLATARASGYVGEPAHLTDSSWGSGKDWRVWSGEPVQDLVRLNSEVADTALDAVDQLLTHSGSGPRLRSRVADQILREALLTISSDWAFMVSKDSAAQYARQRAHLHAHAVREIAAAALASRPASGLPGASRPTADRGHRLAAGWGRADNLFPGLDARRLIGHVEPSGTESSAAR